MPLRQAVGRRPAALAEIRSVPRKRYRGGGRGDRMGGRGRRTERERERKREDEGARGGAERARFDSWNGAVVLTRSCRARASTPPLAFTPPDSTLVAHRTSHLAPFRRRCDKESVRRRKETLSPTTNTSCRPYVVHPSIASPPPHLLPLNHRLCSARIARCCGC